MEAGTPAAGHLSDCAALCLLRGIEAVGLVHSAADKLAFAAEALLDGYQSDV